MPGTLLFCNQIGLWNLSAIPPKRDGGRYVHDLGLFKIIQEIKFYQPTSEIHCELT